MLSHSFVLDCLENTAADTFSHFEVLIEEHRKVEAAQAKDASNYHTHKPSRLKQLVPTIGSFHTNLPLREAFLFYNSKHRLTNRKHIQISFNEIRHVLNMAQIMALREPLTAAPTDTAKGDGETLAAKSVDGDDDDDDDEFGATDTEMTTGGDTTGLTEFNGPKLITFDGDQTLYSDGSNFESNHKLANYLYRLLKHGVNIAVVTAAG